MTTIRIDLPDALAREAAGAGLFEPTCLAQIFERQLRTRAFRAWIGQVSAPSEDEPPMEEIQAEIDAYREERRAARRRTAGA